MTNDFRRTDELFNVNYSITNKRSLMNERFQNKEFGEAINYARSMLEATCKYVYHEITGEEAEISEGRNNYITLKHLSDVTINKLSALISHNEMIIGIKDNVTKIIYGIGNVRNEGSASHGSRIRNIEPQREETLYLMSLAEDTCNFLLKLLYTRTHIEEVNVVNGKFSESDLNNLGEKFEQTDGDFNYKVTDDMIDTFFWVRNEIVIQVTVTFKKPYYDLNTSSESINEYIDDFLPEDVRGKKRNNGEKSFTVYSERHDRNFSINLDETNEGVVAYITNVESD
ncbi:abortive infection family protein [Limosilactobacillus sp. RRLNB_1_1]|uniref:Abortive infection family protein n=1 Tax=Limosilactobacillus albertensis TaxID=2759752 RepID=A0A7W3TRZ7_9LACO|nr:abortive infection family protein [Limosilactobacillus albertensis]MBB1069678.1 abortive infection family protein [Limosilactobacillus albertensis]MCD7117923.1 abortive infection family protein [Limosilactobacillus albertensis]MCD7129525.1 abortive infection family protein [Limosilactobacillus albertensis]